MADVAQASENVADNLRKKGDEDMKPAVNNDDDTESNEEQPLDIGEHYLVKRSDESWRKFKNITSNSS